MLFLKVIFSFLGKTSFDLFLFILYLMSYLITVSCLTLSFFSCLTLSFFSCMCFSFNFVSHTLEFVFFGLCVSTVSCAGLSYDLNLSFCLLLPNS